MALSSCLIESWRRVGEENRQMSIGATEIQARCEQLVSLHSELSPGPMLREGSLDGAKTLAEKKVKEESNLFLSFISLINRMF